MKEEEERKEFELSHNLQLEVNELLGKYGFENYLLLIDDRKVGIYRKLSSNRNSRFIEDAWSAVQMYLGDTFDKILKPKVNFFKPNTDN